ncbi:TerB family tellurite resistance protein [Pelagibius litoralis]|uniref:TerB family tellurite resistance protein n=1 Tax=Pelagibius litoralis TaxID=374515 RepID=A0A967F139_9PROT|nr:TerB family tellurite resistance protein [Pelagibius litoralis]NIA71089.1 TerB family tellurite resistance protein [Pelagibius litoralis]
MLDKIKAFFNDQLDAGPTAAGNHGTDQLQLAAVALLVEAAQMDDDFGTAERSKIIELVQRRFELSEAASHELLQAASDKVDQSIQIFGFTRVVNDAFSADERVEMMEMLWEVAYADGELHDYESNLMRRLAGLLHVSDRDSGEARKRALARLGPES